MKKIFFLTLFCCFALNIFAQSAQKADALAMYRAARNYESMGLTAESKTAYNNAVETCKGELKTNPNNIESYVVLCWSLFRLGEYTESERYSLEALKINPKEYRIMENLGETYFYLNRYNDSIKYLERYVSGMPNGDRVATAYFFLGEIYRITDKPNHADISYSMAVAKESSLPLWWYRLGTVRKESGYTEGAKAAFQRALKLNPNYKEAQNALNSLG